jgi:hypothetical protein
MEDADGMRAKGIGIEPGQGDITRVETQQGTAPQVSGVA